MRILAHLTLLGLLSVGVVTSGCATAGSAAARKSTVQATGKVPIYWVGGTATKTGPGTVFHVRRSASEAGPFVRINPAPITLKGRTDAAGRQLLWTDRDLPEGSVWYYYIEAVEPGVAPRKASPVVRAQVLIPEVVAKPAKAAPKKGGGS